MHFSEYTHVIKEDMSLIYPNTWILIITYH